MYCIYWQRRVWKVLPLSPMHHLRTTTTTIAVSEIKATRGRVAWLAPLFLAYFIFGNKFYVVYSPPPLLSPFKFCFCFVFLFHCECIQLMRHFQHILKCSLDFMLARFIITTFSYMYIEEFSYRIVTKIMWKLSMICSPRQ